jgi:hypothetical protein
MNDVWQFLIFILPGSGVWADVERALLHASGDGQLLRGRIQVEHEAEDDSLRNHLLFAQRTFCRR